VELAAALPVLPVLPVVDVDPGDPVEPAPSVSDEQLGSAAAPITPSAMREPAI
jgi:hypothetical protein